MALSEIVTPTSSACQRGVGPIAELALPAALNVKTVSGLYLRGHGVETVAIAGGEFAQVVAEAGDHCFDEALPLIGHEGVAKQIGRFSEVLLIWLLQSVAQMP